MYFLARGGRDRPDHGMGQEFLLEIIIPGRFWGFGCHKKAVFVVFHNPSMAEAFVHPQRRHHLEGGLPGVILASDGNGAGDGLTVFHQWLG